MNRKDKKMAIKSILAQGIPNGIQVMLLFMFQCINSSFIGNTNSPSVIAGFSTGQVLLDVFYIMIIISFNLTIFSLVPPALGANDTKLCGVYLMRGRITNIVISIPLLLLLFCANKILESLGTDSAVAQVSGEYILYSLPAMIIFAMYDATF